MTIMIDQGALNASVAKARKAKGRLVDRFQASGCERHKAEKIVDAMQRAVLNKRSDSAD